MPDYVCRVGMPSGEVTQRTYSADSEEALRRELSAKDMLVFGIRRQSSLLEGLKQIGPKRERIGTEEFLIFNQELAALVQAGLPIVTSIEMLLERRKNPVFRRALLDVRDQIKAGTALSEAFASHGGLFPRIYSSSLASGERSGEIATVIRRYIAYTKQLVAVRKKVTSALIYPAVLFMLSIGLIAVLLYVVLPRFSGFFAEFGVDLPWYTAMLISVSTALRDNVLWMVLLLAVGTVAFLSWHNTEAGQTSLDKWKLRVPLLGSIWHRYALTRFTRTLATLVSGGIPLVSSLEIAGGAAGNRLFAHRIRDAAQRVREGEALWESLDKSGLFTDMTLEMVRVGESTGALEEMLTNVSDFYDEEIENQLQTILGLLEPAMLVFMGVIVAGLLMAVYMPLIRSYTISNF